MGWASVVVVELAINLFQRHRGRIPKIIINVTHYLSLNKMLILVVFLTPMIDTNFSTYSFTINIVFFFFERITLTKFIIIVDTQLSYFWYKVIYNYLNLVDLK